MSVWGICVSPPNMKIANLIALVGSASANSINAWTPQVFSLDKTSGVVELHKSLVDIPSVSRDETAAGQYLINILQERKYNVLVQNVTGYNEKGKPNSQNIIAFKGQSYNNSKVLLTSHYDTVPPYWPYRREGDYIYGRGSVDAKSCVAAQICAFDELIEEGTVDESDLALLFVVGEEVEGPGMKYANTHLEYKGWDSVIFGEPTEGKLGVGHKGYAVAEIVAHGKAAHSGYPELGVSATEGLIEALHHIISSKLPESELLGPSTVNIGKIQGGVAANVVPSEARATLTFRIAADAPKIKQLVLDTVNSNKHLELVGGADNMFIVEPQHLNYSVPGFDTIVLAYSTDIPNISGDFSRYLYGPGSIHVAHSDNEYIKVQDLVASVDGYKRLVKHALLSSH